MTVNSHKNRPELASDLRRHAEERLTVQVQKEGYLPPECGTERNFHELQVHQIKLEMQNDELRQTQTELELTRDTFSKLYEFAPVAYFTFDTHGVIRRANLSGAQLIGLERGLLVQTFFSRFIADAVDRELFSNHLSLVVHRKVMLKCPINLKGTDGSVIHAQLQSIAVSGEDNVEYILTSIVDNTVRRQLEDKLQQAHDTLEVMVLERTNELSRTNAQLIQEIEEHKLTEKKLLKTNAEIKQLKERLQSENIYLQDEVARHYNFGEIIGKSSILSHVFSQIEQVAPMNATVLLLGETGTGKGVVARAIHSSSSRKGRPLITVNCTTLPAALVESELFGRERGAYTGSDIRQIGRFELADGATIFLDEIGELPMDLQCKLLRVIQDGEFERLGNPRTIKTDVRIIAATNRNLEEAIRNGKFREDLFYRLNVFPITLPPLRQRKDDIPLLVNHFVAKFNKKIGKRIETVSAGTLNNLLEYHWPGNVRELESIIERAVIISQGNELQVLDRFTKILTTSDPVEQDIKALVELEHDHILQVLHKTGWRIEGKNGAAVLLGLNASTLRARMRKYGIARQ